ncbi:sulfoxide reductase heme-binding subunit YedZ [Falsiroseomonas bella]|uniref:Sulfoxide reductase heme-binding subunit YedZ n=1 Tax=Falsiroseomonas bella TaxID=2184016 RepID=A0A317F9W0_9PROT|nr:ferric reductase-like transmembrane domain-containing protein [Falsiroseomonas bella]PWS35854.1 sulfoxide reductase heme-binding subunit YedZ [Falsiroseomonas bella]
MSDTVRPARRGAGRPAGVPWPWLDRAGRISALRIALLVALAAPAAVLLWLLAAGALGADPWKQATREAGNHAAHILLISLAVTPLRWIADWPKAATLRRMVGLAALAYALLHLVLYAGHLGWNLLAVGAEIATRIYLTLGFAVLLGLCVLGWTSTDGWQTRLGRGWKRLHRWVYLLAAAAVLHAFLQSKARADGAVVMAGCWLWLMLWRLLPGPWRARPLALLALALVAALATALVEYAWYGAATNLPAARILAANLDLAAGLRPAQGILLAGVAAALLPLLRRLTPAGA